MNLAPICLYTIIHPARLRAGVPLTEKTKWTRIEAAFHKARQEGDEVVAVHRRARVRRPVCLGPPVGHSRWRRDRVLLEGSAGRLRLPESLQHGARDFVPVRDAFS